MVKRCVSDVSRLPSLIAEVIPSADEEEKQYTVQRFMDSVDLLKRLLKRTPSSFPTLEWLWPKGRQQYYSPEEAQERREDPLTCAMREFREESGISLESSCHSYGKPFTESFRSMGGRNFETKLWLFIMNKEISPAPLAKEELEISRRAWFTYDEAMRLLSPSKREILRRSQSIVERVPR
jgi:hypothetical protein